MGVALAGCTAACTEVPEIDGVIKGSLEVDEAVQADVLVGAFELEGRLIEDLDVYDYRIDVNVDDGTARIVPDTSFGGSDVPFDTAFAVFSTDWEIDVSEADSNAVIVGWIDEDHDFEWGSDERGFLPRRDFQREGKAVPAYLVEFEIDDFGIHATADDGVRDFDIDQSETEDWVLTITP